jgi:hypothetical protein
MEGVKLPAPPLHWPPPAPLTDPPSCTCALLLQTKRSLPAFALGEAMMVIAI